MEQEQHKLILGNSLEKLKELENNSVDAVICDPPYELGFMGKKYLHILWGCDIMGLWKNILQKLEKLTLVVGSGLAQTMVLGMGRLDLMGKSTTLTDIFMKSTKAQYQLVYKLTIYVEIVRAVILNTLKQLRQKLMLIVGIPKNLTLLKLTV